MPTYKERRPRTTLGSMLGDPLTDTTIEIVHTLRFSTNLRQLPKNAPEIVHTIRKYLYGESMPILTTLDERILRELYEGASKHVKMYQSIRQAFALVNHRYGDAMFMGGIDTRGTIEHPEREPCTVWILPDDEYRSLIKEDPDCFLKALCIVDCV